MKKVVASVLAVGALVAASSAFAGLPAGTGVVGSLHDMTRVVPGTADAMGRVCVYCHAPHHSVVTDASGMNQLPLWNHQLSTANFTPYTWATPDNASADGSGIDSNNVLAGPSRLCMSCHDGNVAIDEHGVASNSTWKQAGGTSISTLDGGRAWLTSDLSNTHPIGFDYNKVAAYRNAKSTNGSGVANADGTEIVNSTNHYASAIALSTVQGTYNTVTRNQGGKTIADNLYGGNIMTCATCHEVHNKENAVQDNFNGNNGSNSTTAPNYFLYAKESNSLICLSCHVK